MMNSSFEVWNYLWFYHVITIIVKWFRLNEDLVDKKCWKNGYISNDSHDDDYTVEANKEVLNAWV